MKKIIAFLFGGMIAGFVQAQHTVVMKSGEKMTGQVTSMQNGVVNFQFKGNAMKLNVSDLSTIYFDGDAATLASSSSAETKPAMQGEKTVMAGSYLVRYKVADRNIAKPPKVDNLTEEKGTVVLDITVDKYGHVTKAIPGSKGSTTQSEYLFRKAQQAAESTMFDTFPTTPLSQTGYMIISY